MMDGTLLLPSVNTTNSPNPSTGNAAICHDAALPTPLILFTNKHASVQFELEIVGSQNLNNAAIRQYSELTDRAADVLLHLQRQIEAWPMVA